MQPIPESVFIQMNGPIVKAIVGVIKIQMAFVMDKRFLDAQIMKLAISMS
jgi:hypothetical protein